MYVESGKYLVLLHPGVLQTLLVYIATVASILRTVRQETKGGNNIYMYIFCFHVSPRLLDRTTIVLSSKRDLKSECIFWNTLVTQHTLSFVTATLFLLLENDISNHTSCNGASKQQNEMKKTYPVQSNDTAVLVVKVISKVQELTTESKTGVVY